MAWRINDLINLYLTSVQLSGLNTTQNSLQLCDDLLNPNDRDLLFTFNPLKQEVFDVFNEIVRCKSKYITTLGQVVDFINFCAKDRSTYPYSVFVNELSEEDLLKVDLAEDLLVIIEFED